MIELLPESSGNLIGVKVRGTLTDQDYQDILIPRLEQVMEQEGRVRFLLDLEQDFQGWTLAALWEDTKFGWGSRNNFEKVALVGGSLWMELSAKAGALLMRGELRTFDRDHLQEAWDWIRSQPHEGETRQISPVSTGMAKKENDEPALKEPKLSGERHPYKATSHQTGKKTSH